MALMLTFAKEGQILEWTGLPEPAHSARAGNNSGDDSFCNGGDISIIIVL